MAGKTDALRERYQRFIEGDLERALDLWTDDFVWDGDDSGLPGSGHHEGKQAAIATLQEAVGVWDTFELTPDEFIEQGDTVVVLGHNNVAKADRTAKVPFDASAWPLVYSPLTAPESGGNLRHNPVGRKRN